MNPEQILAEIDKLLQEEAKALEMLHRINGALQAFRYMHSQLQAAESQPSLPLEPVRE